MLRRDARALRTRSLFGRVAAIGVSRLRFAWGRATSVTLIALLGGTLLASVLIPAFETRRILRLLSEITEVIEPARVLSTRLESGLALEYSTLQGYALSGDTTLLRRYRAMSAEETRNLASLERLAVRLGPTALEHAAQVRDRITRWQALNLALFSGNLTRAQFVDAAESQRALRDSIISEIDLMPAELASEAAARAAEVRDHEWSGLLSNAALVVVAMVATLAVVALSVRERRLSAVLERRVTEEPGLREMARALSAAVTIEDAMHRILEGTLATTSAFGAYVELAPSDAAAIQAVALIRGTAPRGAAASREGSLTEEAIVRRGPAIVSEIDGIEGRLPAGLRLDGTVSTGLVAPLVSGGETIGVLALLREETGVSFGPEQRRQMHLLADLAAAVLRRLEVERSALVEAQHRANYELALRETGESLAGAFTIDDVAAQIARSALDATRASGVCVENVELDPSGSRVVVVRGAVGRDVPATGATVAYAGSYAEQAIALGIPILVSDLKPPNRPETDWSLTAAAGATSVLPFGQVGAPVGALFIVGADPDRFHIEATWARTFSHLATLAYEKVRLIDEAREGRLALERLMRSRQRLMRGFSHDVKNPLGAADGYADLLAAGIYGSVTSKQLESIQRIRHSIRRALDLIDDLHELARAETGNIALRRQVVDPGEIALTSADEYRGAAEAAGLPLTVDLASVLPQIETDGARVRQILGNLLSNAIKYTRAGSIVVRVREDPTDEAARGWVDFDVIDTGIGIEADKLELIFEEFSRVGGSDRAGAGLGLAISKRLAEALGGRITVESEFGHGSTFTFRIPIRPPETWSPPAV